MKAFFVTLREYTVTGLLYAALSGRMYTDVAPQGTVCPYAVWSFPSGFPVYDLEDNKQEEFTAQLDIYSQGESEILTLFDQADSDFNGCSLVVPGYDLIRFRRVTQRKIREDSIKRYIIEFSIHIGEK